MRLGWLQGSFEGQPVAVKMFNTKQAGAVAAYGNEKYAYNQLDELQGEAIPHLLRSGFLAHTAAPILVTSWEGNALKEGKRVRRGLHKPMRAALKALHAEGAAHGDVRLSNFVVEGATMVRLVDLGQTIAKASEGVLNQEVLQLDAILAESNAV